ncbi:VWA domain-containing protein [Spirillospora sp. NBC_00431]
MPHDGLFVRRNNAFGTRASMGIADLIENGVLIDQTQIRFDDFVASRSDEVPSPPAGEAVAVSHGCAEPPGDAKARESTTHFLEIALRAADHAPDTPRGEVLPVNFVFAVDTSASMFGEKLDTVKSALHQLYEQLRDIDILGIVTFDTRVSTVLKATPKRELSLERLTQVISGLTATGGTDLNLGLRYGIDEIARYGNDRLDLVNCLYLFSDGDPTSGETDWVQIRKNVAERLRGDLTLSCFGFGTDARTRELQALAGLTGGHCTFVTDPGEVRLNLAEDLTRREHLAAINVQLRIEIDPDIRVWHLYGHDLITDPAAREAVLQEAREARRRGEEQSGAPGLPDLITGEKGIRIFAPDLAYGETYWIVLEIELPDGTTPEDALGSATVQYVDVLARDNRRHEWSLTPAGTISAQTVAVHAIGLWTSEITFYALDDLYEHDRATAKQRLSRHAEVLRNAYSTMRVPQLRDDRVTLIKLISLSGNLDQPATWHDPVGPADAMRGYAVHALNAFGRVRAGYTRHTPHT